MNLRTAFSFCLAVKRNQRKHRLAAHRIIHGEAESIMQQQPKAELTKDDDKEPQTPLEEPQGSQPSRPTSDQKQSVKPHTSRPPSVESQKSEAESAKQQSRTASREGASRSSSARSRADSASTQPSVKPSTAADDASENGS